jgi:hypothetical protein
LKLDNGSLAWEIMLVALFHLGGQFLCPSLVLSPPRAKGYYWGGHTRVTFRSLSYLTLSILEPLIVYQTSVMGHGPFSHEKKTLKAQRLMQLLHISMICYNDNNHHKSLLPA